MKTKFLRFNKLPRLETLGSKGVEAHHADASPYRKSDSRGFDMH